MLADYYNRHDANKHYDKVLFRAGRGLQSAELNEIQSQAFEQTRGIADAILKEGDLVADGQVVIQSNQALIEAGKVYLRGQVRQVDEQTLTIPIDRLIDIGVWLTTSTVTELNDSELRDPATGTRNYGEPGAARQHYHCQWGLSDAELEGDFFPVHKIDNGVLLVKQPPPQLDSVTVALARYDRESNGSYVVDGLQVLYLEQLDGEQHFTVSEGKAHVDGLEISLKSALRKTFAVDPDLQAIVSEPHQFIAGNDGTMQVELAHWPVDNVSRVNAAKQKTVNLQKGIGFNDPLPDSAVYQLVEIKQGDQVFTLGDDYSLSNDTVNWSPSGDEPASGSSYQATYRYRIDVEPDNLSETGFVLDDLVPNEVFFVDYERKLPRIDLITIDPEGVIRRIKGIAHPWQPSQPALPEGQLILSSIEQHWSQSQPVVVINQAIRVVPMAELEAMQQQIADLYDLVAIERLRNDANLADPSAKKGVFVDPFLDDDLRDQGRAQSAAVIDGELMLPIEGDIEQIGLQISQPQTLPYVLEPILTQSKKTGSMKVNPYQAFEPIPAQITLTPAIDRWTEVNDVWTGASTTRFIWRRGRSSTSTSFVETGRTSTQAQFLRTRSVGFSATGFGPNEKLASLVFDGITLISEQ